MTGAKSPSGEATMGILICLGDESLIYFVLILVSDGTFLLLEHDASVVAVMADGTIFL